MKNRLLHILILIKSFFLFANCSWAQNTISEEKMLFMPAIFHINTTKKYTPSEKTEIEKQIKYLVNSFNDRINFLNSTKLSPLFVDNAKTPNIKLYFPSANKEGLKINSIIWDKSNYYPAGGHIPYLDDYFLDYNGFNKEEFLNIWILDLIDLKWKFEFCDKEISFLDLAGQKPVKRLKDGIILDIDDFANIIYDPFIFIHEFGHYLGLKHIWGNREYECNLNEDDGINDTPRQKQRHRPGTTKPQIGCDNIYTNHQNFMDYSYDTGMFTEDQVNFMRNYLIKNRSGLLWESNYSIISTSVLSNNKLRNKLGAPFNFNLRLRHKTNIDLSLKDFFERELGIVYNEHNLKKLGLKIIGTDTFRDIPTNKKVNQDHIYKYLDIKKAKQIIDDEVDIIRKKKQKIYFNIKTGISSGDVEFLIHLSDVEKETFENAPNGNLMILLENPKMTYEFYAEGKRISVDEIPIMKGAKVYNFEPGSYRIVCKLKTFQMGIDDKPKPYNKEIADITFEHLKKQYNTQTILLIRDNNNNSIYQVFER